MLGVQSKPSDRDVIEEFFELFKIPWEYCRQGKSYDAVLCNGDVPIDGIKTRLLIAYAAEEAAIDAQAGIHGAPDASCRPILFNTPLPLYGPAFTFASSPHSLLQSPSRASLAYWSSIGDLRYVRVGYNLFEEVRSILRNGQPPTNASIPSLDLHIDLLRRLIVRGGVSLAEIPPMPAGYPFMVCLTHDMDHALIRRHRFDATMLGFIYRASIASVTRAARGRLAPRGVLKNWLAVVKLPLVHLGISADFWSEFDRYLKLEGGRPSTFFVIPFAGRPGRAFAGKAPASRASKYDVTHIAEKIRALNDAGCEIGLHGIDAWADSGCGRDEAQRIAAVGVRQPSGVRMHWLYSDEGSWPALENADFVYDSTMGYNETVGYRAGTGQVFKPFGASRLRELPMQIMDTALFYPDYLNLSDDGAWEAISPILDNSCRQGGVLTINWHDRSIAPERLWDRFYSRLLQALTDHGAFFCTGLQAVSWFEKRRSVDFEEVAAGHFRARASNGSHNSLPDLRLRIYGPQEPYGLPDFDRPEEYQETIFSSQAEFRLGS